MSKDGTVNTPQTPASRTILDGFIMSRLQPMIHSALKSEKRVIFIHPLPLILVGNARNAGPGCALALKLKMKCAGNAGLCLFVFIFLSGLVYTDVCSPQTLADVSV